MRGAGANLTRDEADEGDDRVYIRNKLESISRVVHKSRGRGVHTKFGKLNKITSDT